LRGSGLVFTAAVFAAAALVAAAAPVLAGSAAVTVVLAAGPVGWAAIGGGFGRVLFLFGRLFGAESEKAEDGCKETL